MHSTKECNNDEARMTNVEEASEDSVHMFALRSFNLPSTFVIFPLRFAFRKEFGSSFHLSRAAGLISERGRKDRLIKNSALNEESRSNSGQNNNAKSH